MGNENTKNSQRSDEAVQKAFNETFRRQEQMYERKCQELRKLHEEEQEKKKQEKIDEAFEALEKEKQMCQKKYEELLQKQRMPQNQQGSNMNHNMGPLTNIQERHQSSSVIYPNLWNFSNCAAPPNMMQPPFMSGPSTVTHNFNYSATVPSAPPVCTLNPSFVMDSKSRLDYGNNNQLDCKSCNRKLGTQVFVCNNKHNSCRNCRMRQVSCGVCRQNITDTRNFALEKQLAGLKLASNNQMEKCPNSLAGCCLHFKPQDIPSHMKECPFNESVCPLMYNKHTQCFWRGKINQLRVHFKQNHQEHCEGDVDKEMTLLNLKDDTYVVYFVTLGAFNFLIHVKVDRSENIIMMTAQLCGTKISAEKWSYQFHVFNKKMPKRKFQYNAICHPNTVPVEDIFSNANCAVLSSVYANSFANNGHLTYKFYLIKDFGKDIEKNVQANSS